MNKTLKRIASVQEMKATSTTNALISQAQAEKKILLAVGMKIQNLIN